MYEEVKVLNHSSIKICGSLILYFDPYEIAEESHDADLIFVTHDHYDHYALDDIKKIMKDDTILVVPECMIKQAEKDLGESIKCKSVQPEGILEVKGIMAKAVPAYNRLKPFHPKGKKYVGYVIKMDDTTYYIAGDTDNLSENQQIKCDVALVPVGGKFTMDQKEAAKLVNQIKPKLAIPTHYGSVVGTPEDGKKFAELVDKSIEVRIQI